jgi:predicted membrane-bound mannosyltransferase
MTEPFIAPTPLPDSPAQPETGAWARLAGWANGLTLADALVALALMVAVFLRFRNLGGPPLSPTEAAAALGSWQFGQAGAEVSAVVSPAYFTLMNAAMLLFGSSDAIARLVPAVLGTVTVALVWFLPRQLRPAGIIAAAAFLALSPLNVLASRTAGGAAIAVFALMLLVVSGLRLAGGGRRIWAYGLGASLGVGLTSDPLFLTGLVALAPFAVWLAVRETDDRRAGLRPTAAQWPAVVVALGASFLLLSTSFLLYTPGLGAAFTIVATWLRSWGLPPLILSANGLLSPLVTMIRYEPALLVLGVPALLWALTRRDRVGWLLVGWWAVLVLAALFQPDVAGRALLFTLPGYLLIGLMAGELFRRVTDDRRVLLAVMGGLLLLGAILLVSIGRYTRMELWSSDQVAFLVLALVAFIAAGGVLVLAMSYNSLAARQGVLLGIALLLLYAQGGIATSLSQQGSNDPRERVVVEGTDDDVRTLTALLRDVSRQLTGGDHDVEVISTADSPVLRWYLRDYEAAQFADSLPLGAGPAVIIAPADADLRLASDYLGADFGLRQTRVEPPAPFSLSDTLKWWLFRESATPLNTERVILWVRSDLTGTAQP